MSAVSEYFKYCMSVNSIETLTLNTFEFLKNKNCKVTLFEHRPSPEPIKILQSNNSKSMQEWFIHFKNLDKKPFSPILTNSKYDYFFSGTDFQNQTIFFFAGESTQSLLKEILSEWQSLIRLMKNTHETTKRDAENTYGNIISQFMHDIQSLMDSNKSNDHEIVRRINYQKKLNKDLLFFIRDFDLFKSEISVKCFIFDSLKMIELNPASFDTDLQEDELKINVDVELFSDVFNVVILNALKATNNDFSKILIKTYSEPSRSPFLEQQWIVFEVKDLGNGIAEEFEPFVSKPFFTTHKHDGHTGFGLANANKIIKAHNGYLDINAGNGTVVKIYLPYKE
jgi:signal transduction histidine kinase